MPEQDEQGAEKKDEEPFAGWPKETEAPEVEGHILRRTPEGRLAYDSEEFEEPEDEDRPGS